MQTADGEQFEELISQLCAGYEVPVTKHRKDAHWAGCRKMSIAQYRRCVEFALSDDGPEDLPTTKALWRIHRQLTSGSSQHSTPATVRASEPDHLEYFANRLLLLHITHRGGIGPELAAALAAKRKIVDEFVGYVREGDELATPAEFRRAFLSVMRRASPLAPECLKQIREGMSAPEAAKPFEPHMARELTPRQAELV